MHLPPPWLYDEQPPSYPIDEEAPWLVGRLLDERASQNPFKRRDEPAKRREQLDKKEGSPAYPSIIGPLPACILIAMWFYNMFLRLGGFSIAQWSKLTTKLWLMLPSSTTWKHAFVDSYDKDNPTPPRHRPRVRSTPSKHSNKRRLLLSLGLLSQRVSAGSVIQLQSEIQSMTQQRKFRACNGAIDTAKLRHSIGDLQAVQSRVKAAQEIFNTKTGGVCSAFNCIADTGCSGSGTNHEGDLKRALSRSLTNLSC